MDFDNWFQLVSPNVSGSKVKQRDSHTGCPEVIAKDKRNQGKKIVGWERIYKGELPQEEPPFCDKC